MFFRRLLLGLLFLCRFRLVRRQVLCQIDAGQRAAGRGTFLWFLVIVVVFWLGVLRSAMIETADGGGDDIADNRQFADGQIGVVELAVFHLVHDQFIDEIADFRVFDVVPFLEFRAGGGFANICDFDDNGFLASWKRTFV